jgi:predicted esterase
MVRARRAGSVVWSVGSSAVLLGAALVACSSDSSGILARTSTASGDGGGPGGGVDASSSPATDSGAPPAGDGGAAISNGPDKPNCKYQAHKTGLTSLQQAGGLAFTVYAPSTYDPKIGHAVVVIMHGQDSNGVPELQALWQPIADQEGLVLVAPRGSRPSTTNDPTVGNWATADLNHVLEIMTDVDDCYDVLTKKHILWGFSEGCFYGYLLGVGAAARFSGLAMGGANMSFARSNGYAPADASWAIPVSHVHGTQDPNPISITYQDRTDFQAAGHVFTLHEHPGGHTISADQVRAQYDDLKAATSP